jgi:hypothetical protein
MHGPTRWSTIIGNGGPLCAHADRAQLKCAHASANIIITNRVPRVPVLHVGFLLLFAAPEFPISNSYPPINIARISIG